MKKILLFLSIFLLNFSFVFSFDNKKEIESANYLAGLNIIDNYSNDISKYRLGENITRREVIKLIVKIGHIPLDNSCKGVFLDVKSNDWSCKYVESSLREGYISKSSYFRPNDFTKKAEFLKMVFKSLDIKLLYNSSNWESNYLNTAVDYGIISKNDLLYSGYDTRGRVFTVIKRSFNVSEKAKSLGYLNIQNQITQNNETIDLSNNSDLSSGNNQGLGNLISSIINENINTTISLTGSDTELIQNNTTCLDNYTWNGTSCVPSEKVVECKGLPENASWNKSYKILQYWDGMNWSPSDLGLYNVSMTAVECRFKCNNGFTWDGEKCIYGDKKVNCTGLPENAAWNSVSSITQKWDGKEWLPKTELVYSLQSSDNECRFKCDNGYRWTGTAQNKCVKEDIIYGGGGGGGSSPILQPTLVNGVCTGLKSNGIYYNNTVSYSLVNAPSGTSLSASYNSNPTQNTCQFKCNTGYSWLTNSCTPNNCLSTTKTINGHDYVVPTFNHNSTTIVQSIIGITNGNKKYNQTFKCNLGTITTEGNETLDLICNVGYVEGTNSTCIANVCSGTISDSNAYSTATSQSVSQTWHYSPSPGVCTWNCNSGYTWNGTSCSGNTRISNCVGLPGNASWNSVSSITQSLAGGVWSPTLTGSYNLISSSTECRFKCNTNYTWNGTICIANTKVVNCGGTVPSNATSSTSTTYTQTWSGSLWIPTLNWGENQSNCDFNCNSGYTWNGTGCIQGLQTVSGNCSGIQTNAQYYNGTSTYSLSGATAGTSLSASYNATPTQNTCQFKCNSGYIWNGTSCLVQTISGSCNGIVSNGVYYNGTSTYSLSGATAGTSLSASYNATPTQNTCQFKCNSGYTWNGTSCIQNVALGYKYVSAGFDSACGIKTDGKLYCWGKNYEGQLGDGSKVDRLIPTLIDGNSTYKQVSMGRYSACGIKDNDRLYCWGGDFGLLGTDFSVIPKLMDSGNLYKKVSIQDLHICGIRFDGKLYCWGINTFGQLGTGNKTNTATPTLIDNGTLYTDIITGGASTCGLTSLGKIKCWGSNTSGGFLDGTNSDKLTPTLVDSSNTYKSFGYDGGSFCGIRSDDKLYCWGYQIGDGTTTTINTPTLIDGNNTYKNVMLQNVIRCGIRSDDKLYCWGNNEFGVLGDGTTTAKYYPTIGIDYNTFKYVSLGNGFNCGLGLNDKLYCWGRNTFGQLGIGTTSSKYIPTASTTSVSFKKVKAGEQHSCGISSDDKIYCWGSNSYGQIGDGTNNLRQTPTLIDGGNTYKEITLGYGNTCGIRTDGKLYCWGYIVGDGTYNIRQTPTLIDGGNTYSSIHSPFGSTCGLRTTGKIYCWGENYDGQFLDGTKTTKLSPIAVDQNNTYTNLGVGGGHICGKRIDGKLYCWGSNRFGKIGDGTIVDKTAPTLVDSGNIYNNVSLGIFNTCGIKSDGKYYCWGMLANGILNEVTYPRLMDSVNTYKNTFGGFEYNCAIRSDDKVYCFGSNGSGEMGNGSYSNSSTYNLSITADNGLYKDLGLFWKHSCGVTIDGKLNCWGNGDYGQLGISGLIKITPTLVSGQ